MNAGPSGNGGSRRPLMAEINMIPLIDVALVLLIIFMVMSPMLVRMQMKVNLPSAAAAEKTLDRDDMLEIAVQPDGTVFVAGREVPDADLKAHIKRVLKDPEHQAVYVAADRTTAFEHVVKVMDAAKAAGAVKLGVGTKMPEHTPPARSRGTR